MQERQQLEGTTMRYHTYLLCLWAEVDNRGVYRTCWRFSLLDPHTSQRIGFKNLEALMAYLKKKMEG